MKNYEELWENFKDFMDCLSDKFEAEYEKVASSKALKKRDPDSWDYQVHLYGFASDLANEIYAKMFEMEKDLDKRDEAEAKGDAPYNA